MSTSLGTRHAWIFGSWVVVAGCSSKAAPANGTTASGASVSGEAGDLVLGASANAMAGTFWGADDGLHVLITDTRDPCSAWTAGRRQPNTSVLVLQFADALGDVAPPTAARDGDYTFVTELFGRGLWFRVVRAYRLDGNCVPTTPGVAPAVAGAGKLDDAVGLPGGRAVGSFSADFAAGSLHGTFSAPFCNEPMLPSRCDYFATGPSICACE